VVLFQLGGDRPGRMLIVIHHLVVDGVSWRILLEDLSTAYQRSKQNEIFQPKTTSFKDWAFQLTEYAHSETLLKELNYWLTQSPSKISSIPVDYPEGKNANIFASSRTVSVFLTEEQTRTLLQEVPKAYHTQINDVLLTALVQSFAKYTGSKSLLIDLEGHGREELFAGVDLSRTVGWFTSCFPIHLQLESVDNLAAALKSIKEQLRSIPSKGIGYGILRYLSNDAATRSKLSAQTQAQISFNYLGQFSEPTGLQSKSMKWGLAQESSGISHSPLGTRAHLLDVNGLVVENKLQMDYIYSENVHQRTTIERLALAFIESLRSLIDHCTSPEVGGYTPSDFSAARLNQGQLDSFLAKIKKNKS
jgi:non-ribosomal peptide synthase protein (TIGR01720 family)